jgi:iron complex transport system permease protein
MTTLSQRTAPQKSSDRSVGLARSNGQRAAWLVALLVALVVVALASLFVGSGGFSPAVVWKSLTEGGTSTTAILINDFRVPRALLAILVGSALGLAGCLIQAITRNPLADPGILGVNSGAYLAVVLAVTFFGATGITSYVWWSFGGALIVSAVVYLIGSRGRGGGTPVRLVLAGVAVSYLLNGIALGISLRHPDTFDKIRFWQAGSLQGRQVDILWGILPFIVVGIAIALLVATSLNAIALGDDLARSLGANPLRTRIIGFLSVTILCGAATAAVGPVAFLGLMAPYVARTFVGQDQRWLVALTAVIAPLIFLLSDMLGRVIASSEVPVGLVTAFVGAPILVFLIRGSKAKGL